MFAASVRAGAAALIVLLVPAPGAAEPIFPTPLHLTRQLEDPISGKTIVIQEYAYGNRLVSVRGSRTSIADYEKSELIEIDRDAGTYSVTRFDAIARARQAGTPRSRAAASSARRPLRPAGEKLTRGGRTAEFFEGDLESVGGRQSVEVAVDRGVPVSRAALEVLTGAAYPAVRTPEHDLVLSAAAPDRLPAAAQGTDAQVRGATYALPVEQVVRHVIDGETLEFRTSVVRVGTEAPPADLVAIPAGARLVESRIIAVGREIERMDNPSFASPAPEP